MSHTDKRLYNYVVNTLGISKEMVMKYVSERLEDLISKHVKPKLDSQSVERMIMNQVTKIVTEGITSGYWYADRHKFETYVIGIMRGILESKVNEEYALEAKLVRKDKSVVGKF